ncbi:alcohol dehydrogenase superfamily, zinc-type [Artemisia annua]|uniref:Alcohol dehydrogenase superfamily, zinc-type n=1 Tax=Artemisia annua TaxID=35608 RepID=A0A2U1L9G6_ARTAN|nr:alcohol dehydrogenase superfamily, zinc-type [Artemisia annua]
MKKASASQKTSEFAVGIVPGEVIDAYGVGKVIASDNPEFEKGDYVVGLISWGEYSISQGMILNKLDPMGFPLSYHVGDLGYHKYKHIFYYVKLMTHLANQRATSSSQSATIGYVGNLVLELKPIGSMVKYFANQMPGSSLIPFKHYFTEHRAWIQVSSGNAGLAFFSISKSKPVNSLRCITGMGDTETRKKA